MALSSANLTCHCNHCVGGQCQVPRATGFCLRQMLPKGNSGFFSADLNCGSEKTIFGDFLCANSGKNSTLPDNSPSKVFCCKDRDFCNTAPNVTLMEILFDHLHEITWVGLMLLMVVSLLFYYYNKIHYNRLAKLIENSPFYARLPRQYHDYPDEVKSEPIDYDNFFMKSLKASTKIVLLPAAAANNDQAVIDQAIIDQAISNHDSNDQSSQVDKKGDSSTAVDQPKSESEKETSDSLKERRPTPVDQTSKSDKVGSNSTTSPDEPQALSPNAEPKPSTSAQS